MQRRIKVNRLLQHNFFIKAISEYCEELPKKSLIKKISFIGSVPFHKNFKARSVAGIDAAFTPEEAYDFIYNNTDNKKRDKRKLNKISETLVSMSFCMDTVSNKDARIMEEKWKINRKGEKVYKHYSFVDKRKYKWHRNGYFHPDFGSILYTDELFKKYKYELPSIVSTCILAIATGNENPFNLRQIANVFGITSSQFKQACKILGFETYCISSRLTWHEANSYDLNKEEKKSTYFDRGLFFAKGTNNKAREILGSMSFNFNWYKFAQLACFLHTNDTKSDRRTFGDSCLTDVYLLERYNSTYYETEEQWFYHQLNNLKKENSIVCYRTLHAYDTNTEKRNTFTKVFTNGGCNIKNRKRTAEYENKRDMQEAQEKLEFEQMVQKSIMDEEIRRAEQEKVLNCVVNEKVVVDAAPLENVPTKSSQPVDNTTTIFSKLGQTRLEKEDIEEILYFSSIENWAEFCDHSRQLFDRLKIKFKLLNIAYDLAKAYLICVEHVKNRNFLIFRNELLKVSKKTDIICSVAFERNAALYINATDEVKLFLTGFFENMLIDWNKYTYEKEYLISKIKEYELSKAFFKDIINFKFEESVAELKEILKDAKFEYITQEDIEGFINFYMQLNEDERLKRLKELNKKQFGGKLNFADAFIYILQYLEYKSYNDFRRKFDDLASPFSSSKLRPILNESLKVENFDYVLEFGLELSKHSSIETFKETEQCQHFLKVVDSFGILMNLNNIYKNAQFFYQFFEEMQDNYYRYIDSLELRKKEREENDNYVLEDDELYKLFITTFEEWCASCGLDYKFEMGIFNSKKIKPLMAIHRGTGEDILTLIKKSFGIDIPDEEDEDSEENESSTENKKIV